MSRPIFAGWENGEDTNSNGGLTNTVEAPSTAAGVVYANNTTAFNGNISGSLREIYGQFRFKIIRLQTNGNGSTLIGEIRNAVNNPSGMPGIVLNSLGQLEFYTYSSTYTDALLMGTSAVLTVGQWYLVQFHSRMNTLTSIVGAPPYTTNALFEAWIDEQTLGVYEPTTVTTRIGIHIADGSAGATTLGSLAATAWKTATNGIYCFDDFIVDSVGLPANEHIIGLRPNGLGTYTAWTNPPYSMVNNIRAWGGGATSNVAAARVSYTLPTLRSVGVTGPTVGTATVLIQATATGAGAGIFILINGVETLNTVNLIQHYELAAGSSAFSVTIQPDDVVEIGYQKDNTATLRQLGSLVLCVSVADVDISIPAPSTDVETNMFQYTGDGANSQAVALPFEPDFLLVVPAGGTTSRIPVMWDSSSRTTISWAASTLGPAPALMVMLGQSQMYVTNAYGTASLNTLNIVYDVVAVRDPSRRVIQTTDYMKSHVSEDNFNVTLPDVTYPIDFAVVSSRGASSGRMSVFHGTSAVGDLSHAVGTDTGSAANQIQSVATGVLQIGSATVIFGDYYSPVLALSTQRFVTTSLIDMVAWTGDGVNPRVLPLNVASAAGLVLVFPVAAGASANGRRAHIRSLGFTGSNSRHLASTGNITTTGITALGTGTFTVQSDCNLAGQAYQAVIFFGGIDVNCGVITIVPGSPLANGAVGTGWALTLAGSGGTGPYTFALLSGALPDGLTLSSAGLLSGIPTVVDAFAFAIRATDSIPCTGDGSYTLDIDADPPSAVICADCGCRLLDVPREDRLQLVFRDIRAARVSLDPRTEVVVLDRRAETVLFENRELDIECV